MKYSTEEGWTYVELVFTLWLMGICLSIAAPTFIRIGESVQVHRFLHQVSAELQAAQLDAVSREKPVRVKWNREMIISYQGDETLRSFPIPSSYRLESNYADQQLVFQPSGQVRGGTIQLWKKEKPLGELVIQVASGRVRVQYQPLLERKALP